MEGLPRSEELLVNLINSGGSIISRPGATQIATGPGRCRGRFVFNEKLYQVSGDRLIHVEENGTINDIGEVVGNADIDAAIGFAQACFVVKGGNGYVLSLDGSLSQITDPDFIPMDEVTRINGRFVFSPSDGSPLVYSDIGDAGSIGALSFFDAEVLTDKNTGVINYRNDLYALGADSIQVFRDVGPVDSPLVPITAATAAQGYIAGKVEYAGSFMFLGKEKDQEAGFFIMGQGAAQRVSNPAIDRIVQEYDFAQLKLCRSQRIVWRGHDMVVFTLPSHSFCFYSGNWSYFQSVTHFEELAPWDINNAIFYKGKYYVGSIDGRIGVMDESNSDFGEPIRRLIKTFMRMKGDQPFSLASISLGVSQGQNIEPGSVGLRLTDDGVLWSSRFFKILDESGDHTFQAHWEFPGGLGYYRNGFIGVEFYTTSEVTFSVDGLIYYEQ